MDWFLSVVAINACFIFTSGQNVPSHVPDFAIQPDLPGSLVNSLADLPLNSVQVQSDPNLHRHGSVVHSHPYTGVHTHPHLPQPSEPVQSDPHLHRHGSVIHSHPYTGVHTHPNLPHPSEPVQNDPYLHRHGSVIHSHPYTGVHTHPNLPHPSEPVHNDPNLHRHGSVVHSHPYTGVHTHPHLPQPSEPVRRIQHGQDPSMTGSGSTIHSHVQHTDVLPVNVLQNEHIPSLDFNSRVDLPHQSKQVTGSRDTHSHGSVVHSHHGGSNTPSHHTLSQSPNQGSNAVGEAAGRRPDIRWLPSYTLAGGQSCNTQCQSGTAPRSCACARFMCYYLGCSSRCSLLQEGDYIRATCQPFIDVLNNQARSTSTLSRCAQPLDPGNCASRIYSRYGYSSRSSKCIRFYYSGCGGNENRFTTRNSCKHACI